MGPELFGVGAAEAVLVFVIALVLVGPQRFPDLARQGGRWYRIARRYTADITKDVRSAIDEIEEEVRAETDDLKIVRELGEDMEAQLKETSSDLDKIGAETQQAAEVTPTTSATTETPATPAPSTAATPSTVPTPSQDVTGEDPPSPYRISAAPIIAPASTSNTPSSDGAAAGANEPEAVAEESPTTSPGTTES
jgi:sec-independent protein translocase protein TatB